MNQPELYTLLGEATASLAAYYPHMGPTIQETGLGNVFGVVLLIRGAEPDALTFDEYFHRFPYMARERQQSNLQAAVAAGFAVEAVPGAFRLTGAGRTSVERVFAVAHADLAQHAPLPETDLARMTALLQRLVDASLAAPEPAHKRALRHSRWTDPGVDAPALVRIDQYLTDLVGYRDDVHIAAWRACGTTGEAWEALTMLWRDQAHTSAELAEKLPFRGHTADTYSQALADLGARGWVAADPATPGAFRLTDSGRAKREECEGTTNRIYFAPWDMLAEADQQDLIALLSRLREVARAAQATRAAPA
jgi:hypothetical protein